LKFQAQLKDVQGQLTNQKELLKGCSKEISEMQAERSQIARDFNNAQLQLQELAHKETKCQKDSKDAAKLVGLPCCMILFLPFRLKMIVLSL
jgi:chromosome segregation ATPase